MPVVSYCDRCGAVIHDGNGHGNMYFARDYGTDVLWRMLCGWCFREVREFVLTQVPEHVPVATYGPDPYRRSFLRWVWDCVRP